MDLTQSLLGLAASTTWDGGDAIVSTLRDFLREDAPFDAGELALTTPTGFRRWTLTEEEEPVAADDLLRELCTRHAAVRFDNLEEVAAFPRTVALMRQRGFLSLLALPLAAGGGPEGAVVLARRFGWAFAGVSLRNAGALVAMAGLCLERALALTALKREVESIRDRGR